MKNKFSDNRISFSYKYFRLFLLFLFLTTNILAQDYKTVVAQKGDGIYSLLKRNGLSPSDHFNPFIELNKSKLGRNNTLFAGQSYSLPIEAEMTNSIPVSGACSTP